MEKRRRQMMAASTSIIPDDLLVSEVLIRLPAKSVARCRCVCRSWRAGIAGAAFVRRHLELSRAGQRQHPSVPKVFLSDGFHRTAGHRFRLTGYR